MTEWNTSINSELIISSGARCVVMKTAILDDFIDYSVEVGEYVVWQQRVEFGESRAHRAAGAAFVGIAQKQERVAHDWADKICAVQR